MSEKTKTTATTEETIDLSSPMAQKILKAAREQARKEFEEREAKRIAEEKLSRVRPMIETAREILAGIEREAKLGDVDRILRAIRKLSSPAQGAYLLLRQTPGYTAKRGRPSAV